MPNVVRALIAANRADIPLSYKRAAAIDLAGRNVLEAVQTSVNPKVIPCPDPASGRQTIDGVAKNGIQLKVKAKVTVRTNLDRLVGGATDETIIARVGEGIVGCYRLVQNAPAGARKTGIDLEAVAREKDSTPARPTKSSRSTSLQCRRRRSHRQQPSSQLEAEADMRVARAQGRGTSRVRRRPRTRKCRPQCRKTAPRIVEAEAEIP